MKPSFKCSTEPQAKVKAEVNGEEGRSGFFLSLNLIIGF